MDELSFSLRPDILLHHLEMAKLSLDDLEHLLRLAPSASLRELSSPSERKDSDESFLDHTSSAPALLKTHGVSGIEEETGSQPAMMGSSTSTLRVRRRRRKKRTAGSSIRKERRKMDVERAGWIREKEALQQQIVLLQKRLDEENTGRRLSLIHI